MRRGSRLRVVVIWHAGMLPGYQAMFERLGEKVDLTVVTPKHWNVAGEVYRAPLRGRGYQAIALEPRFQFRESTLWYPGLKAVIHRLQPQVVHLKQEPTHLVCLQASRAMGGKGKLVFETLQNLPVAPRFPWSWVQNKVFDVSAAAVAITREIQEVLRGFGYVGSVEVLPLWVDEGRFKPGSSKAARERLGLPHKRTLGYVGRLAEEKGLETLFEAFQKLPVNWQALWVGDGPRRDALTRKIRAGGLEKRVVMLGAKSQDKLVEVYRAMDCLVLPSRTTRHWKEQFGRVLVEAMACGVPCVGSDSGAIPEVIGLGGKVFREGDAGGLATAVKAVTGAAASRYRKAAKRQALKYSARRVAEQHVEFYKRLLKR